MKKLAKLFVAMATVACAAALAVPALAWADDDVWDGAADTVWYESNSDQTSFSINTAEELAGLAKLVNEGQDFAGKTVTLAASIDLDGKEWTPIGKGTRSGSGYSGFAFKGVFDGGSHIITGLSITQGESNDAIGLFGVVDGGTVKNLILSEVSIAAANNKNAGAAIGMMVNGATADGITVSGFVTALDGVGGIVGRMTISGTINNCINNAKVESTDGNAGVGGVVGKAYYTDVDKVMTISNCTNNGEVSSGYAAGGIVGLSAANVSACTNNARVKGGTEAGGIVGEQDNMFAR